MSIKIVEGNLLDANEDVLVHQVNCMGVMGAGLAYQIGEKWPIVKELYKTQVESYKDINSRKSLLGQVQWCKVGCQWVVNLFGQYGFGRQRDKVYTDYDALKNGLRNIAMNAEMYCLTVAIPYGIGCGLGGGDWEGVVLPMIIDTFGEDNIPVKIYKKKY